MVTDFKPPKNLISKTPAKVLEHITLVEYHQFGGMLNTPQTGYDMTIPSEMGIDWALDNGCFNQYEPKKILGMLEKWKGLSGCKFAVLPDVIGNHAETYLLSMQWIDIFHKLDYPPAFVIQNGCTVKDVPYNEIAVVFVGGDNEYKQSRHATEISLEAKLRGIWVHWGRVGGLKRFKAIRQHSHIDSFDSTGFSIYPPKIKEWIVHQNANQLQLAI